MSKLLSFTELQIIKDLAENRGFRPEASSICKGHIHMCFTKSFRYMDILVLYDATEKNAYVSVHWDKDSVSVNDLTGFVQIMGFAQEIANKLEFGL